MSDVPRLLGGRYELGDVLGRGGMAEVRRARDRRLGRDVAIKQLRVDLASDPTFQERFRREAQAAAGLNYPNIVAVYDTGEEADPASGVKVPYIVMELVEGRTLRDLLRTGRKIVPAKAMEFTQGVLDALSYSHKAGIVHRDIKPANVMLATDGTVKVMDFGIARAVADTSATMTQTAAVIGTAQYLSPEQARGETVDSRSDIYSAGCLLYELLVGRPPFQGDSPVSVAYQHVREAPVPPSHLDPMITPAMDAITLRALAKDPGDRYQTAAAMRADIGRLLAGQEVMARMPAAPSPSAAEATTLLPAEDPSPATHALDRPKRRRWPLVAFLVVLAVIAAGGIWYVASTANRVPTVTMPRVTGSLKSDAVDTLTQLKLVANPVDVPGADDATKGTVIAQSIQPGQQVAVGTEVTIQVNIGPTRIKIPDDLVGMNKDDAVNELTGLGFTNIRTPQKDPNEPLTATSDQVTNVDPDPGETVNDDTQITIYYATGISAVPTLTGLEEARAQNEARLFGFNNVKITYEQSSTVAAGNVISQDPTPGKNVKRTTTIKIVVAKAPPTTPPTDTPTGTPTDTPTDTPTP